MGVRVAVTARPAPRPLRLSGAPKQTLTRSRLLLARHMTDDELHGLRLGGGTALAMRWQHRVSTDIDYAMDRDMLRAFMDRVHQDLTQDLREMKGAGEIKSYRMGWRSCAWTYPDSGPVSLSASDHQSFDDMDWEEDTHVAVAPTPAILAGKLFGRVLDANRLVVRDGYDLCAAFRHEPEAATRLVQEAKQRRGEDMGCLCATVKGAGRRIIEGRPLQEPVHEDLAHDPWGEFVRLVESVPLPEPARPDE